MPNVMKIMWRRHRWLVLAVAVLMVLNIGFTVKNTRDNYLWSKDNLSSEAYFDRDLKKPNKDRDFSEKTYAAYRRHQLEVFPQYDSDTVTSMWMPAGYGPIGVNTAYIVAIFALGLVVAGWDHFGKFDRFLWSTGWSRRAVYWSRPLIYGPLVALGTAVSYALMLLGARIVVPTDLINCTLTQGIGLMGYMTVIALAAWSLGHMMAQLCGRLWQLAIAAVLVVLSAQNVLAGLYILFGEKDNWSIWATSLVDPVVNLGPTMLLLVAVVIFCLLVGAYAAPRISAENDNLSVIVPSLQWVTIAIGVVVGAIMGLQTTDTGVVWTTVFEGGGITLALGLLWHFWPAITRRYEAWRAARL